MAFLQTQTDTDVGPGQASTHLPASPRWDGAPIPVPSIEVIVTPMSVLHSSRVAAAAVWLHRHVKFFSNPRPKALDRL